MLRLPRSVEMRFKNLLNRIRPEFICEEPGCWQRHVMTCRICVPNEHGDYVDEFDFYCVTHASKNGFCWGCGEFWAGCEDFDFDKRQLCSNCRDDSDFNDWYDEEDEWYDEDIDEMQLDEEEA